MSINIYGLNIDVSSDKQHIQNLVDSAKQSNLRSVSCAINGNLLYEMYKDQSLRQSLSVFNSIVLDSYPILRFLQLRGVRVQQRVATTDIIYPLLRALEKEGLSLYIIGQNEDDGKRTTEKISMLYPKLNFKIHTGYFSIEQEHDLISEINSGGYHCLLVCMGTPLQHHFIHRNLNELRVGCIKCGGGVLKIVNGDLTKYNKFISKLGLEWLFRLIKEPRRLYKRYLIGNMIALTILISKTKIYPNFEE